MSSIAIFAIRGSILLVLFILLVSNSAFAVPEYVPGELLVKFKDTSPSKSASINSIHSYVGALKKKKFKKLKIHHMKLPDDLSVEEAVELYQQDPNVEYAEPNFIIHATQTFPNDTSFSELWGMHNTGQTVNAVSGIADADIDAPEAWAITTGSPNVVIAVVDSGVSYDHPDLIDNKWTNTDEFAGDSNDDGCPGTCGVDDDGDGLTDEGSVDDDDENGYVDDINGWDFLSGDNDPTDYHGHGTHVAGTIAAKGDNNLGVSGVMWQAKIMPLRFLGITGSGVTSDAVEAILYANANGAHIINNSWGGGGYSQTLKEAIDASSAIVVCAAGNNGSNNDSTPYYPASYTSANIISVAATDIDDTIASFSNYGASSVDLGAPGEIIYSSLATPDYGASVTIYSEDFDNNDIPPSTDLLDYNWSRGGTNSTWALTANEGIGGSNALEDSPGSDYLNNTSSWVGYDFPHAPVTENRYTFIFQWKGDLENNSDYLDINYSLNAIHWNYADRRTGIQANYVSDSTDELTFYAEQYAALYFGFGLSTDSTVPDAGVFIDDVALVREPVVSVTDDYSYMNGTSMAAPHVSGVAGLIKALDPACTSADIKNLILNSVDSNASLSGKSLAGGRLNAHAALFTQECPAPVFDGGNNNSGNTGGGGGDGGGGVCFIATAAFGSPLHPYVKELRAFRDSHLLTNAAGKTFVSLYYKYSPPLAGMIKGNDNLRSAARIMLTPLVMTVVYPYQALAILMGLTASILFFRSRRKP